MAARHNAAPAHAGMTARHNAAHADTTARHDAAAGKAHTAARHNAAHAHADTGARHDAVAGRANLAARSFLRLVVFGFLGFGAQVHAQFTALPPPAKGPPPWAKELPGYWESVISQNWRLRMVTPPKGDYVGIPLTAAAKVVADAWDPARDTAEGAQCKSYGAAAIMNLPEHLHISWQDPKTLKVDIDGGTQTRLLNFDGAAPHAEQPSWQGESAATWVSRRIQGRYPPNPNARYLEVSTGRMLPGYLRKNGVPYSANAQLTEDYDLIHTPDGETWLIVTTTVVDPMYLDYPLILSAQFRKQPDASKWDPTPCSATW